MKTTLTVSAFVPALMAGGSAIAGEPILQTENLFAVVTDVHDEQVAVMLVHSAISREGATILPVRSVFYGEKSKVVGARVSVCFTDLKVNGSQPLELSYVGPAFPHEGCIGQIQDYFGAAGVEETHLRPGEAVRVYLNGDLYNAKAAQDGKEQ
ncbi:hypothetical protein [Thalassospira sp. MIT1370]|uniref:hypothetical protein n=1 Tax=unclassified Thalassospira TaxID=2648997 RepID=UPI00399B5BC8